MGDGCAPRTKLRTPQSNTVAVAATTFVPVGTQSGIIPPPTPAGRSSSSRGKEERRGEETASTDTENGEPQ